MSKLTQLNEHLFNQLERLSNEDLTPDELEHEIKRTSAITKLSKEVVDAGALAVSAEKLRQEFRAPAGSTSKPLLKEL